MIPIKHKGFVWGTGRFEELVPVGNYDSNGIRNLHRRQGVGIPLVVASRAPLGKPFLVDQAVFLATLQIHVAPEAEDAGCGITHPLNREIRLEL
ncbi:MAG: hypothetical protein VYA84_13045 [Planctomycetota bacterium]|nr:hypothetical protein [Planctomycetota bacterium]